MACPFPPALPQHKKQCWHKWEPKSHRPAGFAQLMRPRWRLPTVTPERVLNAAQALQDESRMPQETAGSHRWPEEARRSDRTPQGGPGDLKRPEEAPGGPTKHQEAPGGPRRPQGAPGAHGIHGIALGGVQEAPTLYVFMMGGFGWAGLDGRARGVRRVPFLPRILRRGRQDVHVEKRETLILYCFSA